MPEPVSALLVFLQGVASFLSPCVLPLVPAYLAMLGGAKPEELLENPSARKRLVLNSLAFVLGFSLVFIIFGATASSLVLNASFSGGSLRNAVSIFFGFLVVLLGLVTMDILRVPLLERERRFDLSKVKAAGLLRPFLTGAAFSFGWTPCIGPVLASVLLMASGSGTVFAGVGLLIVYSIGLGLPFILISLFLGALWKPLQALKKHALWIRRVSGAILVIMGVMMMTGTFTALAALGAPILAPVPEPSPAITMVTPAPATPGPEIPFPAAQNPAPYVGGAPAPTAGQSRLSKERADALAERLNAVELPPIELEDLEGNLRSTDDFEGVSVINILSSWCPYCVEELPILRKVTSEMGVPLIGLDTFETISKESAVEGLNALLSQLPEPFPILLDETNEWGYALTPGSIPVTLILDADGLVRFYRPGAIQTEEELREMLDFVLYRLEEYA